MREKRLLFLSSADFFSKSTFLKNYFRTIISVSTSSDPDYRSDQLFCRAWSGPKLFTKVISRRHY